ncbi:MAG: protoglobin domain-containing protein [Pirellulaceae bacterium]
MEQKKFFQRYEQLQEYVRWSRADEERIQGVGKILSPHFPALIDDFYHAIQQHPSAARVITGGQTQLASLKTSLACWLNQLFSGVYDQEYVENRSQVGCRHVALELSQVYTNAALSRLRGRMIELLRAHWPGSPETLLDAVTSLYKLLDLELAIIEDAYESEHVRRLKVAERTRMRNMLHQEKEFSEALWEHAQAIILVLDVHGRIIRYNPYLEDLTGVPHREVKGLDWFDRFVPGRERERLRKVFEETIRCDTSATVSSMLTESGRQRRISWSNKSLKNMAGRTVAMLSVGQDITELNQAQQRALQAERLAGIGQMSTGLAHESRNALQRIQACAEMLELEVEGNGEALDLVRRIKLAQAHMHRLFDEVRSYAAPVNLDRSACNLGSVWREAWEMLLPQWEGRIAELIDHTTDMDLGFYGDHFRLVQVFRILFENSLAACADPVRIELTCAQAPGSPTSSVRISVRDNGPGLNQEQREHIFEPFYTTKTKGTGLGMAIAQRIVEAHGGHIAVDDDSTSGANIVITLPHRARS